MSAQTAPAAARLGRAPQRRHFPPPPELPRPAPPRPARPCVAIPCPEHRPESGTRHPSAIRPRRYWRPRFLSPPTGPTPRTPSERKRPHLPSPSAKSEPALHWHRAAQMSRATRYPRSAPARPPDAAESRAGLRPEDSCRPSLKAPAACAPANSTAKPAPHHPTAWVLHACVSPHRAETGSPPASARPCPR